MRSYPLCWVVPGGKSDPNETLYDSMIREIFEETGLNVKNQKSEIIFCWEATWNLKRHYFIVYFKISIDNEFLLKNSMKPQKDEIDAFAWISKVEIEQLENKECVNEFKGYKYTDGIFEDSTFLIYEELIVKEQKEGEILPRISGSTKRLLEIWTNRQ
jgi:8-oxo-dGTP pyrophosphatase MutT (NUDIX family)